MIIAEDHTSMRRSLRLVLESEGGMEVIADASDLATAIRHVYRHRPHVLVLDPWLLDESRVEAVRHLREQAPSTEIVVLTMHKSATLAKQALEAGAIAFVLKDTADSEVGGIARRRVSVLTNHERQTGCGFSAQETVSHTDVTMA